MKGLSGGEWLTPALLAEGRRSSGCRRPGTHVGNRKPGEGSRGKGDAGPGMRVTGGKLAGCGEVGGVRRLGLE